MQRIRLLDLLAHRHHRIERVLRVLHDQARCAGPRSAIICFSPAFARSIPSNSNRSAVIFAVERQQPHDGAPDRRFARTGLADDPELFAAQREADAAHRLHLAATRTRPGGSRLRRSLRHSPPLGSSTSRSASPNRLKARLTSAMAMPGARDHPRAVDHELAAGRGHRAPFRRRRLCAEPEKAEARRGQDHARHVERHAHDHRGNAHRQDVPEDDRRRRSAPAAALPRYSRPAAASAFPPAPIARSAATPSARSRRWRW